MHKFVKNQIGKRREVDKKDSALVPTTLFKCYIIFYIIVGVVVKGVKRNITCIRGVTNQMLETSKNGSEKRC